MLCKPKDDLRKDARLMEFTNIVNRCLKKHQDSRKRDLRTFTATPLNKDCGMLEWVSDTAGLRPILLNLYKEKGLHMSGTELRNCQLLPREPVEKKLKIFKERLLPKHPAIFSEWFPRVFPDPTSWYSARRSFRRTTTMMSMVGYMLGLGDRHGENILLDATCGDCVHIDFSCLFNKGVRGYEGIFRKSCEVTLRVMTHSLMRNKVFDVR